MIDKTLHVLEFILLILCMFFTAKVYILLHNAEQSLKDAEARVERKCEETEKQCQRIADSCIYAMANDIWE